MKGLLVASLAAALGASGATATLSHLFDLVNYGGDLAEGLFEVLFGESEGSPPRPCLHAFIENKETIYSDSLCDPTNQSKEKLSQLGCDICKPEEFAALCRDHKEICISAMKAEEGDFTKCKQVQFTHQHIFNDKTYHICGGTLLGDICRQQTQKQDQQPQQPQPNRQDAAQVENRPDNNVNTGNGEMTQKCIDMFNNLKNQEKLLDECNEKSNQNNSFFALVRSECQEQHFRALCDKERHPQPEVNNQDNGQSGNTTPTHHVGLGVIRPACTQAFDNFKEKNRTEILQECKQKQPFFKTNVFSDCYPGEIRTLCAKEEGLEGPSKSDGGVNTGGNDQTRDREDKDPAIHGGEDNGINKQNITQECLATFNDRKAKNDQDLVGECERLGKASFLGPCTPRQAATLCEMLPEVRCSNAVQATFKEDQMPAVCSGAQTGNFSGSEQIKKNCGDDGVRAWCSRKSKDGIDSTREGGDESDVHKEISISSECRREIQSRYQNETEIAKFCQGQTSDARSGRLDMCKFEETLSFCAEEEHGRQLEHQGPKTEEDEGQESPKQDNDQTRGGSYRETPKQQDDRTNNDQGKPGKDIDQTNGGDDRRKPMPDGAMLDKPKVHQEPCTGHGQCNSRKTCVNRQCHVQQYSSGKAPDAVPGNEIPVNWPAVQLALAGGSQRPGNDSRTALAQLRVMYGPAFGKISHGPQDAEDKSSARPGRVNGTQVEEAGTAADVEGEACASHKGAVEGAVEADGSKQPVQGKLPAAADGTQAPPQDRQGRKTTQEVTKTGGQTSPKAASRPGEGIELQGAAQETMPKGQSADSMPNASNNGQQPGGQGSAQPLASLRNETRSAGSTPQAPNIRQMRMDSERVVTAGSGHAVVAANLLAVVAAMALLL